MARPKIEEKDLKKHTVMVRFSDSEFEYLEAYSKLVGESKAAIIRNIFLSHDPKISNKMIAEVPDEVYDELKSIGVELSRIGNNLNQIARRLNQENDPDYEMKMNLKRCIITNAELAEKINKILTEGVLIGNH